MRVHGSAQIQAAPGVEDQRDVARLGPVGRLFECAGRLDRLEIIRGQCGTSFELDELRRRPEGDEQRGVGVVSTVRFANSGGGSRPASSTGLLLESLRNLNLLDPSLI
jgi:hypothetical protein